MSLIFPFYVLTQSIVRQNMLKKEYVAKDIAFQKQKASESEVQSAQNNYHLGVQRVSRDYDRSEQQSYRYRCNDIKYKTHFVLCIHCFHEDIEKRGRKKCAPT
jgi:predicted transposase YbfD/YdcC